MNNSNRKDHQNQPSNQNSPNRYEQNNRGFKNHNDKNHSPNDWDSYREENEQAQSWADRNMEASHPRDRFGYGADRSEPRGTHAAREMIQPRQGYFGPTQSYGSTEGYGSYDRFYDNGRLSTRFNPEDDNRSFNNTPSHSGKGPKGYKRADDRIEEEVCDALMHDHHIDASDVEVKVKDGVVTLSGTVTERRIKRLAEDCTESVRGVSDVRNELTIKSQSASSYENESRSDTKAAGPIGAKNKSSQSNVM